MTPSERGRHSILVVDDEPMIRAILQRALSRSCDVTTADGPATALEALQQQPFDLVLTDISMPGGNGIDLAEVIRARLPAQRIAFVSAVVDNAMQDRIENLSAPLFLKPFDIVELVTMVGVLLAEADASGATT